jgi:hypothetical protein
LLCEFTYPQSLWRCVATRAAIKRPRHIIIHHFIKSTSIVKFLCNHANYLINLYTHSNRFSLRHSCKAAASTRLNHPKGNYRLNYIQLACLFLSWALSQQRTESSFFSSKEKFPHSHTHTQRAAADRDKIREKHIWRRQTLIACTVQLKQVQKWRVWC